MENSVFGELEFNIGFKADANITLFGRTYNIDVKLKAYDEKDGITKAQEEAAEKFNYNKITYQSVIEKLLNDYSDGNGEKQYTAKRLLFNRDGSFALLCNDHEDEENGIAVCLFPNEEVLSQDEYL